MSVVDLFHQIARNDFGFFQQVRSVSDVMTRDPKCLTLDDTLATALNTFSDHGFRHAPVLNPDDGTVVGVVSDRDVLRHRPRLLGKAAEQDDDQRAMSESVSRLMSRNPICCRSDDSPITALSLMLDHHVDSVLVSADGTNLEGIVTPRDFIRTLQLYHRVCTRDFELRRLRLVDLDLQHGLPLDEIFSCGAQTVRDVMTKSPHTILRDSELREAIALMKKFAIRHLPVTGKDGKLVGFLSDRDILYWLPTPRGHRPEGTAPFRETLFATDDQKALQTPVDQVMAADVTAVPPDTLLTDALGVLQDKGIGGLPVIESESGQRCGIMTTSDILRVFRVVLQIGSLAQQDTVSQRHPSR